MITTAIFGGTFDPPHCGHARLANAALATGAVQKILFIPADLPPHKSAATATFAQRLTMTKLLADELAVAANDAAKFSVSDIEAHRGGVNYTIDTLRELIKIYPTEKFRLLIGADMALIFGTWRAAETLIELAPPLVAARVGYIFPAGFGVTVPQDLSPRKRQILAAGIFPYSPCDTASSMIRRQLAHGNCSGLTPAVAAYIAQENLYAS